MLTEFGKFTRTLRILVGENMLQMAEKLNVSSSFLSAVEMGRKNIPKNWLEILSDKYSLTDTQREQLKTAIDMSSKIIKIDFSDKTDEDKKLMLKLAKRVGIMDQASKDKIIKILNEEE